MKIFNRGPSTNAAKPTAAAVVTPAPVVAAPAVSAPATPAAAPAAPPAPLAPDLSVVLDANVKEMSEKISRLASSIESQQQERGSFEAKLEQMEDRMRKLSSLTEMISAQYNPFVGDAPAERESPPAPEVGLAAPPMPAAALATLPPALDPSAAGSLDAALGMPSFSDLPPAMGGPDAAASPDAMPDFGMPDFGAPPDAAPAAPAFAPAPAHATVMPEADEANEAPEGVYIWTISPSFETSMLLLGWADMLLKSAGSREALLDLVNYYHNIGWIGDPARDQLLAYADGIQTPPPAEAPDWRANVEVHEKSLLFVEKLRAVQSRRSGK